MAVGGIITDVGKNLMLKLIYGAAGYTVLSQAKIGTGTNTPTASDTNLQTPILTKSFVAGYPVFDTTNKKVTNRIFITSAEANGSLITEVGEFNTDGSPIMLSRDVFTGISKSSSDEIAIVYVHKIL